MRDVACTNGKKTIHRCPSLTFRRYRCCAGSRKQQMGQVKYYALFGLVDFMKYSNVFYLVLYLAVFIGVLPLTRLCERSQKLAYSIHVVGSFVESAFFVTGAAHH